MGPVSSRAFLQHVQQLVDLLELLLALAAADGVVDAMLDMVLEHLVLHLLEGGPYGLQLGQDVDAVALLIDHPLNAAHLALDAAQASAAGTLCLRLHGLDTIPPYGIHHKHILATLAPAAGGGGFGRSHW